MTSDINAFATQNLNVDDENTSLEEESFDSRPRRSEPTQYPTGKPNHYSKDRRYIPRTKKSDVKKTEIRSGNGKGARHKKQS